LIVTSRAGDQAIVDAQQGRSLMEIIREAGFDEPFALCGGACSCATCHVYIDPALADLMPPISADEDALLDSSDHRQPNSRLSCQVPFVPAMDGLQVVVAPED
jgi:2Fe-2S ferredoxin